MKKRKEITIEIERELIFSKPLPRQASCEMGVEEALLMAASETHIPTPPGNSEIHQQAISVDSHEKDVEAETSLISLPANPSG